VGFLWLWYGLSNAMRKTGWNLDEEGRASS